MRTGIGGIRLLLQTTFPNYVCSYFLQDDECTDQMDVGRNAQKKPRHQDLPNPVDLLRQYCCMDRCIRKLSPVEIEQCQAMIKDHNEPAQLNMIIKEIQTHTNLKTNARHLLDHNYNFVVAGKSVCLMHGAKYSMSEGRNLGRRSTM